MYVLIKLFFDITLLRKGPQDIPAARWLFWLVLPAYLAINTLILMLDNYGATIPAQIAVDFMLMAGFSWPLLHFSGRPHRFPQTLCALIGADALISFFTIPAVASLNFQGAELAIIAMLGLMFWHWMVMGHILRHALNTSLFFGLGLSLLYILITSQVMALLFPVMPVQP